NAVGTFAASAVGGITFENAAGFTVGTVNVVSPSLNTPVGGVVGVQAGGDTALVAGNGGSTVAANTLFLAADVSVNVGGTNNLLLETQSGSNPGGDIHQASGVVTAGAVDGTTGAATAGLAVVSAGRIDMQSANAVGTFAASAVGGITFENAAGFTVGTVNVVSPSLNTPVGGVIGV